MYNVQNYGINHNVSWKLANTTGYEFEDKIYKIALKELKQYLLEDKMTVEQKIKMALAYSGISQAELEEKILL